MHQPEKRQALKRLLRYLAAMVATQMAAGLIVGSLDAAPHRPHSHSRSRSGELVTSSPPGRHRKKPATQDQDQKKPATQERDQKKPATQDQDQKKPATQERDQKKPATQDRDQKKPATQDQDQKKPVTQDQDQKKPVTQDQEQKKPVTQDRDQKKPATQDRDQKKPVTQDRDQKKPVTQDQDQKKPVTQDQDQKKPEDAAAARDDDACLERLRAAGIRFDIAATPAAAKSVCVIDVPVRLRSVAAHARNATELRLAEEPVVSCQFAERLTGWLGHLVAPLIAGETSAELRAVHTGPGYACRNRNGAPTGKLSAHAVGQAIDITSFELSNGKFVHIKPDGNEAAQEVVSSVRTAACGWFTTVLGPGADAAHTDHLHVDMMVHGSSDRYRICQ